jgi:membrane-associated phospholipid phosphatase
MHIGLDMLRAQLVSQTVTYSLKYSISRERPDGSDDHSLPSGHATVTFATATVLARHFGWKVSVPTYAVASYVAGSRLHEERHYLSDVILGSTIGVMAGRTVTRHGRSNWNISPIVRGGAVGLVIARVGLTEEAR